MDRRTALIGLVAAAGAGVTTRLGSLAPHASAPAAAQPNGFRVPDSLVTKIPGSGAIRSVAIRPAPLGAGGFVIGIDQSADGQRFACRTDVCNAYVRDVGDGAWRPLFSPATMQASDYDPMPDLKGKADGQGCAGVRIAPSNKDVLYASYYGFIWRTTDGGKSIRRTALPQKFMPSNADNQRGFNWPIDIHPTDPNKVMVGTWGEGVWYSADGGAQWSAVGVPPALPIADKHPGLSMVLFGEKDESVYVFVGGVGLFVSTSGGAGHFAPVEGGPKWSSSLVHSRDGGVFLCETTTNDQGQLWKYHPQSGWRPTKTAHEMTSVTVDPTNPKRLFASGGYGFILISDDGGTSFAPRKLDYDKVGGEVRWIGELKTLVVAQVLWDVKGGDTIWYANGVGVLKADIGKRSLTDWSVGIEELIAICGISVPGGSTILTCWDKPLWRIKDDARYVSLPVYPTVADKPANVDLISHGTSVDYAGDDPRFLVAVVTPGASFDSPFAPGFSADGGDKWTIFPGTPPRGWGYGGCIAASTRQNIVILPSNNAAGAYTLDGGKSWETIRLDGRTETTQFANAYYVARKNIAADKTRKGVFAIVYTVMQTGADPFGNPLGGVWLTTDGGRTWKQTLKGIVNKGPHGPKQVPQDQDARQFWRCQLDYVPGHTGELVYTSYADYGDDRLWWSKDDGASWTELHPSIRAVVSFGLGKAAPGQERPALYFYGKVDGVEATWASFDWFATKPVLVARHASPQLANIAWITGDANRFGRVWIGTGGAGWLIADVETASG